MRKPPKRLEVIELFSGTGHISDAFRARSHKAWKVDWSHDLDANLHADIGKLTAADIIGLCGGRPDVIWASPDCTTYSIARPGYHRNKDHSPKTEYARFCDECDQHVIDLIAELQPTYWFIENPRGMMRKMPWMVDLASKLQNAMRHTITYCQYGGETMKPTDIWTNHPNPLFRPPCKNGASCHVLSPRGSSSPIELAKGEGMYSRAIMRGMMPQQLIGHIVDICEQ